MSTKPTAKRKRTEETQEQSNVVPPVRSNIWYDDGMVVLETEGTQFKVHRSLLSQNSSVFSDMFTLPQPSSSTEDMLDGYPVIHLSDSKVDLEYVLEALFMRKYVLTSEPMPVAIIAAFLRLGAKYDISQLRVEALKRVYYEYPTTLSGCDALDNWSMIEETETNALLVHIVNIARENELQSVLPMALYYCCYPLADIATGFEENGSIVRLSSKDLQAGVLAYSSLTTLQARTTFAWMYADTSTTYPSCLSTEICSSIRKDILIHEFLPTGTINGLCPWSETWEEEMCHKCICIAKSSHNAGRQKFWDGIPAAFGFPEWGELEKERHMS